MCALFRRIFLHAVVVLVSWVAGVSLHLLLFVLTGIFHAPIHLRAHHMTLQVLALQNACHRVVALDSARGWLNCRLLCLDLVQSDQEAKVTQPKCVLARAVV
jgi:hypothetical protein